MIDLAGATKGLTDKEIRGYINQTTTKFFEVTLKTDKKTGEAENLKRYNRK